MSAGESDEEVRWNRDHGWTENSEEATNWDNYEEFHYELDPDLGDAPIPVVGGRAEVAASGELMGIDVDSEDRIWYISRGDYLPSQGENTCQVGYIAPPYGLLDVPDPEDTIPDTGNPTVALQLDVLIGSATTGAGAGEGPLPRQELGGQGIAIDPDFEENGYVYVYYHPADYDEMENPYNDDIVTMAQRVSRFEFDGSTLDEESEEVLLEIPLQLHNCCHVGGDLQFGPDGYLYVTTGDGSNNNGNPDNEVNWTMTDERQGTVHGRPAQVADAQRTAGNTADPRGSILRIKPEDDGSYSVPDGNLKDHWEAETGETYSEEEFLPELYVMGHRNPFKVEIDDHTGFLFVGSYGNDAGTWDPSLGTVGQAVYHLYDEPGNGGYPFFKGYYPNRRLDFETLESGQPYWPDNLRNRSVNNTGIENIPNVTPALVWHPQVWSEYTNVAAWAEMPRPGEQTWPTMNEGGSANAGVAYRYEDEYEAAALDPYFDGKQFVLNPENDDVIRYLTYNEDGSIDIQEFLPENGIGGAHEMKVLSDGRLVIMGMRSGIHVIEYTGPEPERAGGDRVEG